uniref:POP1 domain-containing protein n=1 Tax=Steinernema glaseri TaxID=37863 RepID=A0A1I8ADM9_9BILA
MLRVEETLFGATLLKSDGCSDADVWRHAVCVGKLSRHNLSRKLSAVCPGEELKDEPSDYDVRLLYRSLSVHWRHFLHDALTKRL